eukprot:snap_masked-scaffold_11-processed-gene-4.7-mRNA-1 protein AED:1.00 eAED:1.00 QI:0/0/0/0/1/1/2/0/70
MNSSTVLLKATCCVLFHPFSVRFLTNLTATLRTRVKQTVDNQLLYRVEIRVEPYKTQSLKSFARQKLGKA